MEDERNRENQLYEKSSMRYDTETKFAKLNEIVYQGNVFYRTKSGWTNSLFEQISFDEQNAVEDEYRKTYNRPSLSPISKVDRYPDEDFKSIDFKTINRDQLLEIANNFKNNESYTAAIYCYKKLILKQNYELCKPIYPKLLSCFRSIGEPEKAFQLLEYVESVHGKNAMTQSLLTSATAAFCDMGLPTKAIEYATLALKLPNDGKPIFLYRAIQRLKNTFPDYYQCESINSLLKEYETLYE